MLMILSRRLRNCQWQWRTCAYIPNDNLELTGMKKKLLVSAREVPFQIVFLGWGRDGGFTWLGPSSTQPVVGMKRLGLLLLGKVLHDKAIIRTFTLLHALQSLVCRYPASFVLIHIEWVACAVDRSRRCPAAPPQPVVLETALQEIRFRC